MTPVHDSEHSMVDRTWNCVEDIKLFGHLDRYIGLTECYQYFSRDSGRCKCRENNVYGNDEITSKLSDDSFPK